MLRYFRRKKQRELYRQWVEKASLSPDAIPREEVAEDIIPQVEKQRSPLNILSILFGVSLLVLCAGLILFMVYSC